MAGYSWTFNRGQAGPADVDPDGDATTTEATYQVPDDQDGEWWFHVSPIDNAGNQS